MENNNIKLCKLCKFYKDIDEPIINNMITDDSFKNILELSSVSEIQLLKKQKDNWCLIDKKTLLKNITTTKNKKLKEIKNNLSKIDSIKINDIKENNNKLFSDLESIDLLKNNIEDDNIYNNIKNLSLLSNKVELKKKYKKNKKSDFGSSIKIIDIEENIEENTKENTKENIKEKLEIIKLNLDKMFILSDSDDYIEVFTN